MSPQISRLSNLPYCVTVVSEFCKQMQFITSKSIEIQIPLLEIASIPKKRESSFIIQLSYFSFTFLRIYHNLKKLICIHLFLFYYKINSLTSWVFQIYNQTLYDCDASESSYIYGEQMQNISQRQVKADSSTSYLISSCQRSFIASRNVPFLFASADVRLLLVDGNCVTPWAAVLTANCLCISCIPAFAENIFIFDRNFCRNIYLKL